MASALFIWSFIQSFVIGGIVSLVKRTTINYILSSIFVATALNVLLQYIFRYTNLKYDYAQYIFLPDILDFLLPALIFWYVSRLLGERTQAEHYWYFLPAGVSSLSLLTYSLSQPGFVYQDYIGTPLHKVVLLLLVVWKLLVLYKLYQKLKLKNAQATPKQPSLLWWPRILMIFVGITGYIALVQFVHRVVFLPYLDAALAVPLRNLVQFNYIFFSSSIILFTLYFPFKYPKILSGEPIIKPTDNPISQENRQHCERLNNLVDKEQIHLDSELNEKGLADQMGIPPYILSRLLNEQLGKSFSEFINEKRIEAAQEMLRNDRRKKLTNFAVAVDSGFRSESVFYVNFKKITGMTPAQYKKLARKRREESQL